MRPAEASGAEHRRGLDGFRPLQRFYGWRAVALCWRQHRAAFSMASAYSYAAEVRSTPLATCNVDPPRAGRIYTACPANQSRRVRQEHPCPRLRWTSRFPETSRHPGSLEITGCSRSCVSLVDLGHDSTSLMSTEIRGDAEAAQVLDVRDVDVRAPDALAHLQLRHPPKESAPPDPLPGQAAGAGLDPLRRLPH